MEVVNGILNIFEANFAVLDILKNWSVVWIILNFFNSKNSLKFIGDKSVMSASIPINFNIPDETTGFIVTKLIFLFILDFSFLNPRKKIVR